MANQDYPKILIIGESLHSLTGTGITLSNLFTGWPSENVAILSGKNIWWSDVNMCSNFFIWRTQLKVLYESFSNLLLNKKSANNSGKIETEKIRNWQIQDTKRISKKGSKGENGSRSFLKITNFHSFLNFVLNVFTFFTKILGLDPYLNKIVITKSLTIWYESYRPDVVMTFLNNSAQFRLVLYLNKTYKVPIVVYPMDDHIKLMPSASMLYFVWKYKINKDYNKILKIATGRLSICDYMSRVYRKRYHLNFSAFHNPVEVENWLPFAKRNWSTDGIFNILYMGRLGFDNKSLLHLLAQVVDQLNSMGYRIQLELRLGILSDTKTVDDFKKYRNTQLLGYISHSEMPKVLSSYDLLYFPLGFDKKTIKIYSVSMSTKISEYMISGTPILVHAPRETAYYEYAKKEKWGYLLDNNAKNELKKAILELLENEQLRKTLGEGAVQIALQNHDAKMVRDKFRLEIVNAVKKT